MKISKLKDIENSSVSHNAAIKKKVIIKNGEIPNITYFSAATFPPGEIAYSHIHQDMTEVFFIQSGMAEMVIDGQTIALGPGTCITVEPNEQHELRNVGTTDLDIMYFGVITK